MTLSVIITFGFLLSTWGGSTAEPYTVNPLKNTGVLFEDLGSLMVYHSTWSILTELDLTELDNQTTLAERAEHYVHQLCGNNTGEELCELQQKHVHALMENIKRRTKVIKQAVPKSRKTRSIFDGIGNAMHYLFGTMDNTNEREVYSRLDELESNHQVLADLEKQQISVVKTALNQIQKPLSSLVERQRQIAYQMSDLHNSTNQLTNRQTRQEIVTSLLLQMVEIEFRQQALLDIITASRNNQIHPLLIAPDSLLEIYHKSHSTCPNMQSCLSTLYQTAEIRSHLLQEKLVIKINLPIFNLPKMRLQRIRCFPIHTGANHSLVPEIEYSHIASQLSTQEFLLLKPENMGSYKKITRELEEDTYAGRLNTPITKAAQSDECVIKLLFNPLGENPRCSLKVQLPPRDVLMKLNRPNSWLYALNPTTIVHITCTHHIQLLTHRLAGQGILVINRPCHLQIGPHTLYYEAENRHPLQITQPAYFPNTNETAKELDSFMAYLKQQPSAETPQTTLLLGDNTNQVLHESTQSLEQIQAKLQELQLHSRVKMPQVLSTTSLSLTGFLLLLTAIYIIVKYAVAPIKAYITKRNQTRTADTNTEEAMQAPTEPTPKPRTPPRPQTLPRAKTIRLV